MVLIVNDVTSTGGGFAADSPDAADAAAAGLAGGDGAIGVAGLVASNTYDPATLTGTTAGDSVVITRNAFGQWGGDGGAGGRGGNMPLISSDGYAINEVLGDAGAGGSGGGGGLGGSGTATIAPLTLRLGQGGFDTIDLRAWAIGGNGGDGNFGGDGGTGGDATPRFGYRWFGVDVGFWLTEGGGSESAGTYSRTLGQGGDAGDAGAGGRGGDSLAAVGSLGAVTSLKAAATNLAVVALAQGGHGGGSRTNVIDGTTSGVGDPGGDSFDGARGGDGGDAIARIEAIQASFTAASTVTLQAQADGGIGHFGYAAGEPYPDFPYVPAEFAVVTYSKLFNDQFGTNNPRLVGIEGTVTYRWGEAGVGGDGGDGGDALARLAGNRLTMSGQADTVFLQAWATAGQGGAGGAGSAGRAASTTDVPNGDGYSYTIIDPGFAATAAGAKGANGTALIELVNNRIDLGAGDDVLALSLIVTSGDGVYVPLSAATITASGNAFIGGDGADTLNLAGIGATNLTIDLAAGRLKAGAVTLGTLSGFETIIGSAGADRFIDGAGNQTYRPSGLDNTISPGFVGSEPGDVRDTFVFAPGHGDDWIIGFDATGPVYDRIDLRAFGTAMDTFREVRAAARDEPGLGCVIDTPDGGSITLLYVAKAELLGSMFLL